jgi:hypothetical protein
LATRRREVRRKEQTGWFLVGSLDHVVGASEDRLRHGEAERLRGLE